MWALMALVLGQDLGADLEAASRDAVKFFGYEVAMSPGHGTVCGWNGQRQSKLMLDGPRRLRVLFKVDHGKVVDKMMLGSEDCEIDAGAQTLVMLPNVTAAASIKYLASRADDAGLHAISLHADALATRELIAMARDAKNAKRQKKAFFWLARSKDPGAERFIESILH